MSRVGAFFVGVALISRLPEACAAGSTVDLNQYLPRVYPSYPPDSTFQSLIKGPESRQAPTPTPDATATPQATPSTAPPPPVFGKGGIYAPGSNGGGSGAAPQGGGFNFQVDDLPPPDPGTVPRELVFEPHGKSAAASPVPSPSASPSPNAPGQP